MDILNAHKIKISRRFYLSDAIYLRRWKIHVIPETNKILKNIFDVGSVIDPIEQIIDDEIILTSFYRPFSYNALIGGSKRSAHCLGKALDFKGKNKSSDEIRELLRPYLLELGIRMERLPGASWVHVDTKKPVNNRYFKP